VCLRQAFQHIVAVTEVESLVHLAKTLLHGFRVEAETVEPDVVLGQADVDVECVVFFGALEERGDDCGGTDEAGLVV
jgi:hypothetical protein